MFFGLSTLNRCSDQIVHQFVAILVNDPELCSVVATFPIATDNVFQHGGIAVSGVPNHFAIDVIDTGDEQRCSCEVHFLFLFFLFLTSYIGILPKILESAILNKCFFVSRFLDKDRSKIAVVWHAVCYCKYRAKLFGMENASRSDVSPFISTTYDSGGGAAMT